MMSCFSCRPFLLLLVVIEGLLPRGCRALQPSWQVTSSKENILQSPGAVGRSLSLEKKESNGLVTQASLDVILFNEKLFRLRVVDNPNQRETLAQVMQKGSFIAGVNGGYFHPNGTPLGLLKCDGLQLHGQERAAILSGLFVSSERGMVLLRAGEKIPFEKSDVLQAGPFLIDHRTVVPGLERTRRAWRTFLATDGTGNWAMGIISPVTLATASELLLGARASLFSSLTIQRALNLDGGSSSALWTVLKPDPFSFHTDVTVRDFLGLETTEKKN